MTEEERYRYMTEEKVSHIVPQMAIPSIVSMLITSIYNMADTYFVSRINTEASAAVGVIFSIMSMIQALGFTLGMGCGNYVSRLLGAKETEKAKQAASTVFMTSIIVGVVFAFICQINLHGFVSLLGAIPEVRVYAMDYAQFILLAAPFMMGAFLLNNLLRAQGNAVKAMIGICTGGIINMILDPLFIFSFSLGIRGAAIATCLGQFVSFVLLYFMLQKSENCISMSFGCIRPSLKLYGEVIHTGLPSLFRQGLGSVASVILNNTAGAYGAATIAAVSIVNRSMMLIYSSVIGFGQGLQPVCGFNFGAKKNERVLSAYYFSLKVAVGILAALGLSSFVFAKEIMWFMKPDDAQVIRIGARALRFQCITLPFQGVMIMSQFMIQSIGYGGRAALIAMGRQGIFLIPAYLFLPAFLGVDGILAAQPISDVFTLLLSWLLAHFVVQSLKRGIKE